MSKSIALGTLGASAILLAILLAGCSDEPSPTPSAKAVPSPTVTAQPGITPEPTPTMARTSTPTPAPTPTVSFEEYLSVCEVLGGDENLEEDVTNKEFSGAIAELLAGFEAVIPPAEVAEWHSKLLSVLQNSIAIVDLLPEDDTIDFGTVLLVGVAFVADMEEVEARLPDDVRRQMVSAGCMEGTSADRFDEPEPTATPTATSTPVPTNTPTATLTPAVVPTSTPAPTETPAPVAGGLIWEFETEDEINSSPTVADGFVYVGSDDSHLYALNADTGSLVWRYRTQEPVRSSPTVVDRIVYFGSNDGNMYALDVSAGDLLWKYPTGWPIYSSPTVADGSVYFGSYDGRLYALDASTGEPLWRYQTDDEVRSSPVVADGIVYFGSDDDYLYAVDAATGSLVWRQRTQGSVDSSPTVVDGVVYVGSWDNKYLHAFHAVPGDLAWQYPTGNESTFRSKAGNAVSSSPAVANGVVYFGSDDEYLHVLNSSTGEFIWRYRTDGWVSSSPAVANGVVYFGSDDDYLYAISASSSDILWRYDTGGWVESSPTVADGVVYVGSDSGRLYAVVASKLTSAPTNTSTPVPTNTPTPTPMTTPGATASYDEQGFVVPKAYGLTSALQLDGAVVCVLSGAQAELNLQDFANWNNLHLVPMTFGDLESVLVAYLSGQCDAATASRLQLATLIDALAPDPTAHVILPFVSDPMDDHGNDFEGATRIAIGEAVAVELENYDDFDVLVFRARPGTEYVLTLDWEYYEFRENFPESPLLAVYSANGQEQTRLMAQDLWEAEGPSISLVWRAVTGGDYYIVIGDGNTEGASAFSISEREAPVQEATLAPTQQATPPAGSFDSVSGGGDHTCGLRSDGSVACWGWDYHGQATPPQ